MPLSTRLAGTATRPRRHEVDARWLMAYAAGLGDTAPCYFDTTRTIAMHPVFPVCVEWDSILDLRYGPGTETLTAAEQTRAVHADHDIHLLRPPVPGETLSTTATAVAVEQRRPGAYLLKRLDTVDSRGELVMRTWQGTLYRDVAVIGEATAIDSAPAWPAPDGRVGRAQAGGRAGTLLFLMAGVGTRCSVRVLDRRMSVSLYARMGVSLHGPYRTYVV